MERQAKNIPAGENEQVREAQGETNDGGESAGVKAR
jgi:hypothetical protein